MKRLVWLSSLIGLFLISNGYAQTTDWCDHADIEFCYPMSSGGSGTTLEDASANNIDGTFVADGRPAWSTTVPSGYSGYSLDFERDTGDYVYGSLSSNSVTTLTTWVNLETITNSCIVSWTNADAGYLAFGVTGEEGGKLFIAKSFVAYQKKASSTIGSGDHHVAFIYTTDASTNKIYYDATELSYDVSSSQSMVAGSTFYIGNEKATNYMDGRQKEVAIFSGSALSAEDIDEIMTYGLEGSGAPAARRRMILFN